ncbi:MAG: bifunctional phosphoribosylaminoimidazolecarboxamide formyltransferase/IMP cyclohydrolase [Synergistaceae bacterium]|nr:bifunctional phosphoribosylaminoimidazolecarboxamide formyltransferase/IMP cyclohydrolase [Synergistaceae bacterium]
MSEKRVLISVWNKEGVVDLAKGLSRAGWEIVSSSGTATVLREAGLSIKEVADLTGYPHMLGGRVKTLHPSIFGGILARRHFEEDLNDVERFGIPLIDMVVCNLYPFEAVSRKGADLETLLENIDIGGVTLIRAAAKNYHQVVLLTDPSDYSRALEQLENEGNVSLKTRQELALKGFAMTASYDATIFHGISKEVGKAQRLDETIPLVLKPSLKLRYGENPHQEATLALPPLSDLPWKQLSGKEMSYNNILDLDAALRGCALFQADPAAIVIKHTTPSGISIHSDLEQAYLNAVQCDPVSAFGGIVGLTRELDMKTAERIAANFTEVLVAPSFAPDVLDFLSSQRPGLRVIQWNGGRVSPFQFTGTWSGVLVQEDALPPLPAEMEGQWIGTPRRDLWPDLLFAWKCTALSKSNAIVVASGGSTLGIGRGFTSRVDAVQWALAKAGEGARGAVLASDAFFPFPDSIELAAAAGISAIIQPGGSIRDQEVFESAKSKGISLFISGRRTFRH